MNIRCLVQTLFLGSVIILLSTAIVYAEYDFPKDPELDRALADIVGKFGYNTATVDDCRAALPRIKNAISKGTFEKSKDYLAHAYAHQGMLLACVSTDPAIPDEKELEMIESSVSSFIRALQLAPNMDLPYFLLGLYHKEFGDAAIGDVNKSIENYRKAENYFRKALELEPGNNEYQSALDEVRQLIPVKRVLGFKPIPFE